MRTTSSIREHDRRVQFHLLSFEGPDAYAQAGDLARRVTGLAHALVEAGCDTHLWFIGDPDLPGHDTSHHVRLHRWCQWISRAHPRGVYDGEEGKEASYASSLPPFLLQEVLLPHLRAGGRAVILAEEWHTVHAVRHLDWLLRQAQVRGQVTILWNANHPYAFERIEWHQLAAAATLTTVSRSMKHRMQHLGVNPFVVPTGLSADALVMPEPDLVEAFRTRLRGRRILSKVAPWDANQRWGLALDITSAMQRRGWQPLLIAHGGTETAAADVLAAAATTRGLRVVERTVSQSGVCGLLHALADLEAADVVHLRAPLDPSSRRLLFRGSDAVLAHSAYEPCGLVGLETMAVGGVACTGCSGEDYAIPGRNALVLETTDAWEFLGLFEALCTCPARERAIRCAGRMTAQQYRWSEIITHILVPRLRFLATRVSPDNGSTIEPLDPLTAIVWEATSRRTWQWW